MTQQPTSPRQRHPSAPKLDIGPFIGDPNQLEQLKFSRPEPKEEREARIRRENFNNYLKTSRETLIFLLGIAGVGVIIWFCIIILQSPTSSPDDKKWAQTILGSIVTAVIGYLIGKSNA